MRKGEEKAQLDAIILAEIDPVELHEKQLVRYAKGKARTAEICDYIKTVNHESGNTVKWLEKEYEALSNCGSWLLFRDYYTLPDKPKMIAGCTCKKHLLCGLCAIRRTGKCLAIYSAKIKEVVANSEVTLEQMMITFTVKNGTDLAERFEHLVTSMRALIQKRTNSLKKNPKTDTVLKHVSSAVYTYEVTYNEESGEFHPHIHMVALLPEGSVKFTETTVKGKRCFVPWDFKNSLIEDWKRITGDSKIIDVRKIEESKLDGQAHGDNSLTKAIIETFKYAVKVADHEMPIQIAIYEALKGRRLIGSFGSLRGVVIPSNLNDKPLSDSELPYIDLVYQYSGSLYGYQEVARGKFDIERAPVAMLDLETGIKRNKKDPNKKGMFDRSVEKRTRYDSAMQDFIDRKETQHDDCLELMHDYYASQE